MKGELILNLIFFCTSLYLYYVTGTFKKFGTYAKSGPEFWPRIVLVLMIFCSGILLIKNITSLIKAERAPEKEERASGRIAQEPYRFLLVVLVSFAYAFGMGIIGFLLSTILFQIIFLYLLKIKRLSSILFVSLLNTAMLYVLFIQILNMLLPAGVGIFRTFSLLFY